MNFYQQLNHYYDILFPANAEQIEFIERHCQAGSRILDIAAGTGNQAILLAKQGFDVTATDSEAEMVTKIEEKSALENISLQALVLSMEKIELLAASSFDVITCIGNSIVHLPSVEAIRQMINDVYKMLENDGAFIIQIVNYDRIIADQVKELPLIKKPEGVQFQRNYEFSGDKIIFTGKLIVEVNGDMQCFENQVELYPLQSYQLISVLQEAGFSEISLYGDFKGGEYSISSQATVAVAKK